MAAYQFSSIIESVNDYSVVKHNSREEKNQNLDSCLPSFSKMTRGINEPSLKNQNKPHFWPQNPISHKCASAQILTQAHVKDHFQHFEHSRLILHRKSCQLNNLSMPDTPSGKTSKIL